MKFQVIISKIEKYCIEVEAESDTDAFIKAEQALEDDPWEYHHDSDYEVVIDEIS